MNSRTYRFESENPLVPFSNIKTPTLTYSRVELVGGGFVENGDIVTISLKLKALTTATNTPTVATAFPNAIEDVALSCIDITSGIGSAIDDTVACGLRYTGVLYLQTLTTDHIYAVSGSYVKAR